MIITNATTAEDNYKYDSHHRVMTFVYRRAGRNHQGLGCTDQQQSLHKQETTVTSLEDPHLNSLEPQQDQPFMNLKLPNLDVLHLNMELL